MRKCCRYSAAVVCRLHANERELLNERARQSELSLQKYLRRLCGLPAEATPEEAQELARPAAPNPAPADGSAELL